MLSIKFCGGGSEWDIWKQLETFFNFVSKCRNMSDTKRKICVWVSNDMYNNVVNAGYDSPTVAVIKGFELLIGEAEHRQNTGDLEQVAAQITAENKDLKTELQKLNISLQEAPDPKELIELRVRSEELEKHNETLKEELAKASQDKEDLKETHKNYMIQVQTLINQKAIEAPGAKKPWWQFW